MADRRNPIASGSTKAKQPSVRQATALTAFFESGSAVAAHRATGISERQVRRLVKEFDWLLEGWQVERDAEHRARVLAREVRIQDWKDRDSPTGSTSSMRWSTGPTPRSGWGHLARDVPRTFARLQDRSPR